MELSLIVPCYNEEKHIYENLNKLERFLSKNFKDFEIILVEDKSKDKTLSILEKWKKDKDNVSIIIHEKNMGRGKSVADGICAARGEVVGFLDIDFEVSYIFIPEFVEEVKRGADLVIADRVYWLFGVSLTRLLLSRGYAGLVRWILGLKFRDTEAGFKFFNRQKILPVLKTCTYKGWFWDTEIVFRSQKAGLKIVSRPVLFVRDKSKKSTVRPFFDSVQYLKNLIEFKMKYAGIKRNRF